MAGDDGSREKEEAMLSDDAPLFPAWKALARAGSGLRRFTRAQYAELAAALHFLTVLPLPGGEIWRSEEPAASPRPVMGSVYYPVAGLFLGGLLALLAVVVRTRLPALVLAALLVVGEIVLTGGLHLDGLMDSCDGLFGGRTPERRLAIMDDSRVGSFGVLGALSLLLVRFAVLASLPFWRLIVALLVAPMLARWTMVLCGALFPAARSTGLGAAFHQSITVRRLVLAALLAALIAFLGARLAGLLAWLICSLLALLVGKLVTQALGGLTGDVYGAVGEMCETGALLVLLLFPAAL
jgi:adenosylcobinamide-GDP ribazoletransferase